MRTVCETRGWSGVPHGPGGGLPHLAGGAPGLIRQFLDEAGTLDERTRGLLADYFGGMSDKEMVSAMMAGVRKGQLRVTGGNLGDYLSAAGDDYPFAVDPLPNLYFTREPLCHHRHRRLYPQNAHRHPKPGDPLWQIHL